MGLGSSGANRPRGRHSAARSPAPHPPEMVLGEPLLLGEILHRGLCPDVTFGRTPGTRPSRPKRRAGADPRQGQRSPWGKVGTPKPLGPRKGKSDPPTTTWGRTLRQAATMLNMGSSLDGESHSPVVHELWVLVVAGSNPASPTSYGRKRFRNKGLEKRADHRFPLVLTASTLAP